jgi:glyoxylate/succinic semialdehyde reductase
MLPESSRGVEPHRAAELPRWKPTPEAVAEAADVIQIVVADPPAVRDPAATHSAGAGPGQGGGESSTIDPGSSADFAALVGGARGPPTSRLPSPAASRLPSSARPYLHLGGDRALIADLEPTLGTISAHRFVIGSAPQAAALKLAMNLNIAAQMEALSEALTLARRAGIDDAVFFEALGKDASYSGVTKLKEPKLRAG